MDKTKQAALFRGRLWERGSDEQIDRENDLSFTFGFWFVLGGAGSGAL